jgi:ketosteroid isomerase-like protein
MAMSDAERQLVELEQAWMDAVRGRDMGFLEDLLAADFTLTTGRPGVEVRSRREYLEVTREGYFLEAFEFEEVHVRLYGNAGVVRSRYRQRGRIGDEDRTGHYLMTDIFMRTDGRWKAAARHITPLATERVRRSLLGEELD